MVHRVLGGHRRDCVSGGVVRLYAVTATCVGEQLFSRAPHTTIERRLMEAVSPEEAVRSFAGGSSVYSLGFGKTFEVREVGEVLQVWSAVYDGQPLNPGTELIVSRRVDLERTVSEEKGAS